jgi:myo-inositol-1(or 4)-monophosphatase
MSSAARFCSFLPAISSGGDARVSSSKRNSVHDLFRKRWNKNGIPRRPIFPRAASASGQGGEKKEWTPTTFQLDRILEVAIKAANEGGYIMRKFGSEGADIVKTKVNTRDLLTKYDKEVQDIICSKIKSNFPNHRILGEEDVAPGADAAAKATRDAFIPMENINTDGEEDPNGNYVWVIDPIDGTTNFVSGMPLSAISIGVCSLETKEVIVAVIYDPFRRETFYAIKGRGAFMDEQKISVDNCSKIDDCLVATGYAPTEESSRFLLQTTTNLTKYPVRSIRMLGSAAIMLAWVACGRVSCYIEESLNAWDTAAGALLVAEAGGIFTDFSGKEYDIFTRETLASSGNMEVHKLLLKAAGTPSTEKE